MTALAAEYMKTELLAVAMIFLLWSAGCLVARSLSGVVFGAIYASLIAIVIVAHWLSLEVT